MRYFVLADPHSYYSIMIKALQEKGFDENDDNHKIILCGDAFDRGTQSIEMFEFIKKMQKKDKLIYIRGNHEDLLDNLLCTMDPKYHDLHNGTVNTICQFSEMTLNEVLDNFQYACMKTIKKGIKKYLNDSTIDYYETNNYIFVHGYVTLDEDWKKGSWSEARWLNGVSQFLSEKRIFNKTIVCGHYHCNWYRDRNLNEEEKWKDFSPQEVINENNEKIIAIDACTAFSKQINVLIIDD
ncbi:putative uncharacterized protein [Coprobacillus sp. CAG:698]|nr:putative uncharacterized protein [Coprobacillus sp. CAG:698]